MRRSARKVQRIDRNQPDLFAAGTDPAFPFAEAERRPLRIAPAPSPPQPIQLPSNDPGGEGEVLARIVALLTHLWEDASGEPLFGPPQNAYRGKASIARVSAGQPASPSSA